MATAVQLPVQQRTSIQWRYALAFLVSFVVIVLRRPDAVFHAQFYAEDGRIFYAQAHNLGLRAIFIPYQGYIHLFPRLAGAFAVLFPLAYGPLVQNILAVCVETLPVLLLISPVCERWGSLRFRLLLAFLYLTVPNCAQILGSITESQWILALVGFLIVTGEAAALWLLGLCCLTGPFCIFLLPFARKRNLAIVGIASAIQLGCMAASPRSHVVLGASFTGLLHILGAQVYAGALLGPCAFPLGIACVFAVLGTAFLALAGERKLQSFAAIIFAAALLSPTVVPPHGGTAWTVMAAWAGKRYWFIPCLAVAWSIAYGLASKREWIKALSIPLAVVMVFGIARDFHQPARPDFHFTASVERYNQAPVKARVSIPEPPEGWSAVLIK